MWFDFLEFVKNIYFKKYVVVFLHYSSDVLGEQKSGSGRVRGLLFGVGSGSGINISGTSPSGLQDFGGF